MTNNDKTVCALTFAYNAEKTLGRCVDSVLGQGYENLVYYVCDDGSQDSTRQIINKYAKEDDRVTPIYIDDKSRSLIDLIPDLISTILMERDDGYFVSIDADDEYKPDFLEKMLPFVTGNGLDLAICGSESASASTGDFISRKKLGYDLILTGKGFSEFFPVYRRYLYDFWGKVYAFPAMKKAYVSFRRRRSAVKGRVSELFNYEVLRASEKVGLFGESLHKYYICPDSYTAKFIPGHIEASIHVYDAAREFLLSHGELSKANQDYLYAIYLGHISEVLDRLYKADMPESEKLPYISRILDCQLTKELLAYDADPQYRNLAARKEFLAGIENRIAEGCWAAQDG